MTESGLICLWFEQFYSWLHNFVYSILYKENRRFWKRWYFENNYTNYVHM